jgi:hypothetical protein
MPQTLTQRADTPALARRTGRAYRCYWRVGDGAGPARVFAIGSYLGF